MSNEISFRFHLADAYSYWNLDEKMIHGSDGTESVSRRACSRGFYGTFAIGKLLETPSIRLDKSSIALASCSKKQR